MTRSCSIFFYEGWLSVAPTILNLSALLSKNGYRVVIYTRETEYCKPTHIDPSIEVVYCKKYPKFEKFLDFLPKFKLGFLRTTFLLTLFASQISIYRWKNHRHTKDSLSLGVDTNGAILAAIETWMLGGESIYVSLELSADRCFSWLDKWRAIAERLAYRRSVAVLIQDEDRFKALCKYARWEHPQVFYIPNSLSSDYLDRRSNEATHKNFFRDRFDLAIDKYPCLILQAGSIDDLVFSKELASAFKSIEQSGVLIFHERECRDSNEPYLQMLRSVNSNNLLLSLEPLPYEQIDLVFSSATIGLAFYRGVDDNFARIAKASGKLSGYLKHGKPVLMSDLDSLTQLNDRYQFGIAIADPASSIELERAIDRIMSNYDLYSKNALRCYQQEFDFNIQSQPFLEFIIARSNQAIS